VENFEEIYELLRALAQKYMGSRASAATLQPTALVHEAWLKLSQSGRTFESKGHFAAVAAKALRQVLIDAARARSAAKRGSNADRVTLSGLEVSGAAPVELIAIDRALHKLTTLDERQARLVELRVFAGLTNPDVAEALGMSLSTVEREWRKARAWLVKELELS
jgi:RNA polymerase sigma-70 factor, ECF subfamily